MKSGKIERERWRRSRLAFRLKPIRSVQPCIASEEAQAYLALFSAFLAISLLTTNRIANIANVNWIRFKEAIMSRLTLAGMVVVLLLGSSVVTSCTLFRKDTDVTISQVPPPVRKAIEKETAGGTIKSIEKIESGGKVTYEVEYMRGGKEIEVYFTEDGRPVKGVQ